MRSLSELSDLKGKVAVITGGAGHIGQSMATALAELGADLVLIDINEDHLQSARESISGNLLAKIHTLALDLEDLDAPEDVVSFLKVQTNGQVDVLVNNAAFVGTSGLEGWVTDFESQSPEVWTRALHVNLTVAFTLSQACAPMLKKSGAGSIVNIGSIYGMQGPDMALYSGTEMGNPAAYAASKGGLLQLTRWMSTVLSPEIRVNSISPGGVKRGQVGVFQERYVKRTPLCRMANEEDFKGAIAFLASDLSAYVTGQNIVVDGGWGVW